jgi:predicted DNA-binding transcriptional regulator YafY
MSPAAALAFFLAERYLEPLFPPEILKILRPYLDNAREVLDRLSESRLQKWSDKVRIVPQGPCLIPPQVDSGVMSVVYEALLLEQRFQVRYHRRGESRWNTYVVNPLGLVLQDKVLYLVASLWGYQDVILLVLHRMQDAILLEESRTVPEEFLLDDYIAKGNLQFTWEEKRIKLEFLIDSYAGAHLKETPLSEQQILLEEEDGRLRISAEVLDTDQLFWWLLGFGANIEVLSPQSLRSKMKKTAEKLSEIYR